MSFLPACLHRLPAIDQAQIFVRQYDFEHIAIGTFRNFVYILSYGEFMLHNTPGFFLQFDEIKSFSDNENSVGDD